MALSKLERRIRIKKRIRNKLTGTKDKPRFSVYRSNKQIYVQLIDDGEGKTLLSVSSRNKDAAEKKVSGIKMAKEVGKLAATKCKEAGIEQVIFDRNGYLYHGRIKALADAAREGGLKF